MATRTKNPSVAKTQPVEEQQEEIQIKTPAKRITIPRIPAQVSEKGRAKVTSVYVEVGANLGTSSFRFGTTAEINDENESVVKNRLYFEGLKFLEDRIKELSTQDGPFSRR